jgi:hypothetical protein
VDKTDQIQENNFYGSGWSFPVLFSAGNYQLNISAGEDNINESIELILATKMGERCFDPEFGSGLQQFFFKQMNETLQGEITDAVKVALLHNEPRISVKEVTVSFSDQLTGLAEIAVLYVYNQTNTRHNYVYPFHLKEGTNLSRQT